jgi:hypothetical protein
MNFIPQSIMGWIGATLLLIGILSFRKLGIIGLLLFLGGGGYLYYTDVTSGS